MKEIVITTDGTINNTKLTVDGKDITKKEKVTNISLYAHASFKGSYSGDTYKGSVGVSYATINDEGMVEHRSYGESDTKYLAGIGQKITSEDQVSHYLGQELDDEVSNLVDKITAHCEENKIPCPPKAKLVCRQLQSLRDKAEDLGLEV